MVADEATEEIRKMLLGHVVGAIWGRVGVRADRCEASC